MVLRSIAASGKLGLILESVPVSSINRTFSPKSVSCMINCVSIWMVVRTRAVPCLDGDSACQCPTTEHIFDYAVRSRDAVLIITNESIKVLCLCWDKWK